MMKRIWIIIVNVFIMLMMMLFVIIFSNAETKENTKRQIEHFENTTITMEHVTQNYLEGEQRICDVWAQYINNNNLSIDEAISFIKYSHVLENTSAHIVYKDTLSGLSTRLNITTNDYQVNYTDIDLLKDVSWIHNIGESINVSRAYTNKVNGEQSIAFCNFIKLYDGSNSKDAILLRILPISELKERWIFPQEEFKEAELSIIDVNGDYIIKGHSFKNSNFFEFYKSYNKLDSNSEDFFHKITSSTGSFTMLNSRGNECILAYTPFDETGDWTLLSLMPIEYLVSTTQNWLLIGVISIGLVLLFIFDLAFMIYFNKKLQASANEASLASKAKTNFLSTMSHDIRTPMNAIIGFTTIAKKNIDDKKRVEESLHKIDLASNHLLTLINDILDISKVESGKLSLAQQNISIVSTVENLVNISTAMVNEKRINFSFYVNNIEYEDLYVDPLRLNQIYINILSNALKYTEPGGDVSVNLTEEASLDNGYVKLIYQVKDTGIGMSPEFMEKMYQPFSRETDSRVNSIQGTGLGLAITKKMVDLMNGTIHCVSEVGKGTTFTVTLDIEISKQETKDMKLPSMNVLIVDSDLKSLNSNAFILKALGLDFDNAKTKDEVINKIQNNHYDLLILDNQMSNMESIEIVKEIKEHLKSNIKIILMSISDMSDNGIVKRLGIDGYLSKPLFKSTLFDKINEINGKDNQNENENDYSDLRGIKVLVAEDHDINFEIVSSLLSMYGIECVRAINGLDCLNKVKEAKEDEYTLIFMDIQMPVMNGLEATKAIRALEGLKSSIPIVAMTADAFSENITECLNAGMNGHISKPIDINIVIKEIRRIKEDNKK